MRKLSNEEVEHIYKALKEIQRVDVSLDHILEVVMGNYSYESRVFFFMNVASQALQIASEGICHAINLINNTPTPRALADDVPEIFRGDESQVAQEEVTLKEWNFADDGSVTEVR